MDQYCKETFYFCDFSGGPGPLSHAFDPPMHSFRFASRRKANILCLRFCRCGIYGHIHYVLLFFIEYLLFTPARLINSMIQKLILSVPKSVIHSTLSFIKIHANLHPI